MDCLEHLRRQRCNLLITDVKMPDMSGIELLIEARRIIPALPVIVITGFGDVPMAVRAMRAGAWDFIEKPLRRERLLSAVESALKHNARPGPALDNALSKTETKVLSLILDGKSNKETAALLHRSVRTIEDHRSNIMQKLGVVSVVDLVKRATVMGLLGLPNRGVNEDVGPSHNGRRRP